MLKALGYLAALGLYALLALGYIPILPFAIIVYCLLILAYIGYGQYCARRNRSIFFEANVNVNVMPNVEDCADENTYRNIADRRHDG